VIVGRRKPLEEIVTLVEPYQRLLILGCGTCVTVCMAGGLKEAEETASLLRLCRQEQGRALEAKAVVAERVCEREYLESVEEACAEAEAILSLACGVGTQVLAAYRPDWIVLPGLDTCFYGYPEAPGLWKEMCLGCGNCVLHLTGGICPVARCGKGLLNGPCGGSVKGKCEVRPDLDCAWQLIWERLEKMERLDLFDRIQPPKDWSAAWYGGPRTIERKDVQIA
jgi:ferredoxin